MLRPPDLDRSAVRRQFDRRVDRLPQADFLLREVERRMFERLDLVRLQPARVLDVGCGLGDGVRRLRARYPAAQAIGLDLSAAIARRAAAIDRPAPGGLAGQLVRRLAGVFGPAAPGSQGSRGSPEAPGAVPARIAGAGGPLASYLAGDAHALPLAASGVDLIWSNLVLHWFDEPFAAMAEWYRTIRPGGLLMFSALGVDTLCELRRAGLATMPFPDMHDLGDALAAAGFAEPVMDAERLTITWGQWRTLELELRALGGDARRARSRGLSTPRHHAAARQRIEPPLRRAGPSPSQHGPSTSQHASSPNPDAPLSVTFEVIYGHAWCGARKKLPDGYAPVEFRRTPPHGDAAA